MSMIDESGAGDGDDADRGPEEERSGVDLRDAFYAIGLVTLVVAVLTLASELLAPIALATLLWFFINAIANFIQRAPLLRHIVPEWLAVLVASLLTLAAMGLAGQVVVQNIGELSQGFVNIDSRLANAIERVEELIGFEIDIEAFQMNQGLDIQNVLTRVVTSVGEIASSTALVLLFVLFLLLDQPFYEAKIRALFPDSERQTRVKRVLRKIGEDTRIYIWLMTVVSVIVGLATYALASAYGVPGAGFWGFLAFALNYIPTIGSFLGVIFPGVYAFALLEIEQVLAFVALLGIVQFVMGNIVLPRLMGDRLNLSQFVVILSLSIWGAIWGAPGLFLAVPLMMVLAIVLSQFTSTRSVAILMSKDGKVMSQSGRGRRRR